MDNTEILRIMYGAWNDDDFERASAFLHPDVEWRTSGLFPGLDLVYQGPDGVRRFWQTMMEAWSRFDVHLLRIHDHGDTLVTEVLFDGVGRESGATAKLDFAHAWWLRDGLVVSYSAHASLAEARAAAGLA